MNTREAIRSSMDVSLFVLKTYLSDLEDADLLRRPGPDCNHLAWQLGHLISSEVELLDQIRPGQKAELPNGFAESHAKDNRGSDDAAQFKTKQEYLDLFDRIRAETVSALETITDEQLDAPSPESFREYFPTVGHMFTLIGTHPLMHAGQFAVVRRQLGKPVLL